MILRNCKSQYTLMILLAIFTSLILAYLVQPIYSQTIGGVDLNKIPGLENFTGSNNGPPEALDDGTQDTNNAVPELNKASDETNPNQVKISYTGTITQMDDRMNMLYGNVKVGTLITGEYTYKLPTKDTNTDQTVGDYPHDRKAFGITVNIGGLVFKTDPKNVNFLVELVNRDSDHYLLRSYNNLPLSDTVQVEHIS